MPLTKNDVLDELQDLCREFIELKEKGNASAINRPEYKARYKVIYSRMKEIVRTVK